MPLVKEGLRQQYAAADRRAGLAGLSAGALAAVTRDADAAAFRDLGIRVLDVSLRKAMLTPTVQDAVFRRMRAERAALAADYRAQGAAQVAEIRAKAEAEQATILADAYQQAERRRGEGDPG